MKNKNFIIVVIGQIISLFGNAIQRFSMSLYLLDLTGSAKTFSTILAISTIPYIIFAPIAGLLADTVNRKKIMVYLDFISAALMGIYAVIIFKGVDNTTIVCIVMFMLSTIYTLYSPSVTASIPQIVDKENLKSANGIIQQVGSIVNLTGPIIAGILYSLFGIKVIIVINAISFFASAILELLLNIPNIEIQGKIKNPMVKAFREMGKSFIYLKKRKKVILGVIISYALTNIFVVPILSIIAPYFIKISLNMPSTIYGIVEGIFVLGMMIGGLVITIYPKKFNMKEIHKTMYPIIFAVILMTITTLISTNKIFTIVLFALGGLGIMFSLALSNIISLTYIQEEISEDMLGKVSAFSTAVATISVGPGQLIYGQLIELSIPLYLILLVSAILILLVIGFVKWNVKDIGIKE